MVAFRLYLNDISFNSDARQEIAVECRIYHRHIEAVELSYLIICEKRSIPCARPFVFCSGVSEKKRVTYQDQWDVQSAVVWAAIHGVKINSVLNVRSEKKKRDMCEYVVLYSIKEEFVISTSMPFVCLLLFLWELDPLCYPTVAKSIQQGSKSPRLSLSSL